MSKINRAINAFIIDDQKDYIESIKISARSERILLESSTNLETGIELIRSNKNIDFVILDGKCFLDEDQELTGSTVNNIPIRAKGQLDEINREQNRTIRYCVNTGFYDDLHSHLEGVFTVFKKDNSDGLLKFIKDEVSQSETYKLKNKYNECFHIFDKGIVDSKYEHLLVDILNCIEKSDYRKKNNGPIRDLLEAIYLGLIGINCIPSTLINEKGNPILESCTRYMEQRPTNDNSGISHTLVNTVPIEMKLIFRKLKEATSAFSHLNDNDIIKYPFLANAYSMLELLEWLPKYYDQNYK
jgi:hypothetical protein